jgi:hypothetical protein
MYKENGDMMKKPEFPKPRLIREDFLPEPMNKYRIKKGTYGDVIRYYPQEKFLFWWHNTVEPSFDGGYSTLEQAQEALCSRIKKSVVEYIDFDPERDCK